jgi:hypothetical protein
MKYVITVSLILLVLASSMVSVYAQQPELATYRETAQVLVDEKIQNQTTAFITLSSTSPLEMRVPTSLDNKINNAANVTSVTITNADPCIPGAGGQTCVIITIYSPSLVESYNITNIQTTSHAIGDTLIGDINNAFSLNVQFWEVYVQPKGELSTSLGTSGSVVGNRTINVVYTTSQQKSSYLLDTLSSVLLPSQIRNGGGFYDVATQMAQLTNSTVTFAITPTSSGKSIYQLQVSKHFPNKGEVSTISPLELFGVNRLDRSSYFSSGYFPLNSLFELSAIANHDITISSYGGNAVPTTINNGQVMPADLSKAGWLFDPGSGPRITAIYLFGTTTNATADQLTVTLGNATGSTISTGGPQGPNTNTTPNTDYSIYVIIGIVAAGAAAIYFFMKKR